MKLQRLCPLVTEVWPVQSEELQSQKQKDCSKHYTQGYVFTIYYWKGSSNYFHLTYDMMLPLYQQIYHNRAKGHYETDQPTSVVLMPSVETSRLKVIDWETQAFTNTEKYWVQMSKFMAGKHEFHPLEKKALRDEIICFDELYLGTPKVDFGDAELVQGFIDFVKSSLGIAETELVSHRMALVSRKGRRKILNEVDVVRSLQTLIKTDLLEFSGMSFAEQVISMQKYTVFAALNGAGLMNALYLPKNAVAIQMVPYQANLNVVNYGILLKSRGPYLEWHNSREDLTQTVKGDKFNTMPNTIVDIEDFTKTVRTAIELYNKSVQQKRDEL